MEKEQWNAYVDGLVEEAKETAKTEVMNLLDEAKNEGIDFVKEQADRLETYLVQLAKEEISREEFKSNVLDMKTLTEMEAVRQGVAAQAAAQRFVARMTEVVIGSLFRLL